MYRLYNPYSGEHFYTAGVDERDGLRELGWTYEGVGWYAPEFSDTPVYRLYNPYAGEHHYTMDAAEKDSMEAAGWVDEGMGWYSDNAKTVPLYRDYNPNAFANNHNYTVSKDESLALVAVGWREESIAWYGCIAADGSISGASKTGWQNPTAYYQTGSTDAHLPSEAYRTEFCYVTPSRIAPDASREECVEAMIARAQEYLGTSYRWGYALAPDVGVDCSGLVIQALYACGMETIYNPYVHMYDESLTPTTNFMLNDPRFMRVSLDDRERGDLVFYGSDGAASHVGIYLGDDEIINATPPQVEYDSLWRWEIVGVVRPFVPVP